MSIKDYIVITLVVVIFGAGWQAHTWYSADSELKILKAINKAKEESRISTAEEIAKIKITQTTVYNTMKERITTETVYKDCAHSDDSFNIIKGLFK